VSAVWFKALAGEAHGVISGAVSIVVAGGPKFFDIVNCLIFKEATLEEVYVRDDAASSIALDWHVVAVFALEVDRHPVSAFPGRENESHIVTVQAITHRCKVI